ncbi:hypothetical protein DUNSADRAFT_18650 [Dunaliella salina]|nr:hypothetical protein DUNSADRAFT_18650 [Dunaliella salina]|eukprot:KAF5839773.1 hypothetical protein DUNSADRAFT_18650 [Dunaliella salina]
MIGMHLSDATTRMNGSWMRAFNAYSVANFFGIEARAEEAVPNLPGVTMSKPVGPRLFHLSQVVKPVRTSLKGLLL